jgi:hypothetical protein
MFSRFIRKRSSFLIILGASYPAFFYQSHAMQTRKFDLVLQGRHQVHITVHE